MLTFTFAVSLVIGATYSLWFRETHVTTLYVESSVDVFKVTFLTSQVSSLLNTVTPNLS